MGLGIKIANISDSDRTIKHILKDNNLLHPLAEESFPDREGILLIISGKHVSYERVRKTLILLVFYVFWVGIALKQKNNTYRARIGDYERCLDEMNRYLVDSGYPELYAGNPYDSIFMYAAQDDYPLTTFREYMNELFIFKQCSVKLDK